jgi:tyrosyl-tRNA synthetase
VAQWADRIRGQLERFVDFGTSPNGAVVENNLSWTQPLGAIEFLRDVGKYFSVNVMLDRDTIRRRLDGEGISYTEFSYMLLQANDYVELHQRYGCSLQIGGSDQWGNIIAGVRLVRQKLGATVHALTVPLVTAADGTKFGKSTGGGSLWLDPEMTSPYAWYQYFVNTADADVIRYLRWFTFLSVDELAELEEATASRPHERAAQRRLARELTTLVHGEAATAAVEHAAGRGSSRDIGRRAEAGRSGRHRRPTGGDRSLGEQRGGPPHRRRRRGIGQQRPGGQRGLGGRRLALPARPLAGASSREAEYRRRGAC